MTQPQRMKEENIRKAESKHRNNQPLSRESHEMDRQLNEEKTGLISRLETGNQAALLMNTESSEARTQVAFQLQRTYGNAYVQRLLNSGMVQRQSEEEEEPVQMKVQRQEEEEELQMNVMRQEEEEELQTKKD